MGRSAQHRDAWDLGIVVNGGREGPGGKITSMGTAAKVEEVQPPISPQSRPGVFIVGSPSVGKRTLLSRLLSIDIPDESESFSGVLRHEWTIDTKYYSADLCLWTAHLDDDVSLRALRSSQQLTALIMIFDMNDTSTFKALQNWVAGVDLSEFEILLCVGNKADLLPRHPAHVAYRRRLQNDKESSFDVDYGIDETEGSSLLGEEEKPSYESRSSCIDWCTQHNIEFLEACAANVEFDKCLSVDGDIQGVDRILGALSAHMWPGMVLKSGERIAKPTLSETEYSEEESEFEIEYERLSGGSDEEWTAYEEQGASSSSVECAKKVEEESTAKRDDNPIDDSFRDEESGEFEQVSFENLEQVMSEIGTMRENLRLMPDFQRREAAAQLAMKVAALFGEDDDSDG